MKLKLRIYPSFSLKLREFILGFARSFWRLDNVSLQSKTKGIGEVAIESINID